MKIFRRYRCLVYSGLAGVFLLVNGVWVVAQEEAVPVAAAVDAAEEGVADANGGGAGVEAWMNVFQTLSRFEAGRFVGVNTGTVHTAEAVQESLLPVLRTLIETRDLLDREPDFDEIQFFNLLSPDLAAVFREAFEVLKADGKFAAAEVDKYLSDLEVTVKTGARFTDLCGTYLLQQVVPITHSQSDRIIHEQLYSRNAPPMHMDVLMSISWSPLDSLIELLLIPQVVEILGPEQKKHIDHVRTLIGDNSEQEQHMRRLSIQVLLEEADMPEEKRFLNPFMQSYFETAVMLWQREYGLDKSSAKKLGVAARVNLGKSVEYFDPESNMEMDPMKRSMVSQLPGTHLILQIPGWQKMVEKISQGMPAVGDGPNNSPYDDYKKYIGICQELNMYYVLTVISIYGPQLGGAVESDGLTGAQIEALIEELEPLIHEDKFEDLPDFELFIFILNDCRDVLTKVLNEKQMKVVEEMSQELSRELEQAEERDEDRQEAVGEVPVE